MKNTLLIAIIFSCLNLFGQEKQQAEYKTTKNGVKIYEPSKFATTKNKINIKESDIQSSENQLSIDELDQLLQDIDLKLTEIKKNNPESKDIPVLESKKQETIERKNALINLENE